MSQLALRCNHTIDIMTSTCNLKNISMCCIPEFSSYVDFLKCSCVTWNSINFSEFLGYVICPSMFFGGIMSIYVIGRYYNEYIQWICSYWKYWWMNAVKHCCVSWSQIFQIRLATVSALTIRKKNSNGCAFSPKHWKIKIAPAFLCNAGCGRWMFCRGWLSELWADWQRCCSWEPGGLDENIGRCQRACECGVCLTCLDWTNSLVQQNDVADLSVIQSGNQMGCRSWIRNQLDMNNGKNKLFELIHDFSARPSPMGLRRPRWNWVS